MRAYDNGCFYTVVASETDVEKFAMRWPCFGRVAPVTFEFEKSNGDLVDVVGGEGMDDGGLAALAEDCQAWAAARMDLCE